MSPWACMRTGLGGIIPIVHTPYDYYEVLKEI
jgi:hypothetical protein